MAILDIHDLGLAREKGRDLVGVMALVQRPLAAVLAQPGIRTPKDLEGERAGVTGLPSDAAVLRSVVQGAGGDPDRVRETTIGFEAVKALLARRVAGATAFWNVEGVAAARAAPRHPRVPRRRLRRALLPGARPDASRARRWRTSRRSCARRSARCSAATRETQNDPESAVSTMLDREPGLDRADALRPARRRRARLHGRRRRVRRAATGACCGSGRRGTRASGS